MRSSVLLTRQLRVLRPPQSSWCDISCDVWKETCERTLVQRCSIARQSPLHHGRGQLQMQRAIGHLHLRDFRSVLAWLRMYGCALRRASSRVRRTAEGEPVHHRRRKSRPRAPGHALVELSKAEALVGLRQATQQLALRVPGVMEWMRGPGRGLGWRRLRETW